MVEEAAAADPVDFDVLFQRLYPQLFRYVQRLTGSVDAANDITQESFVRLLSKPLPEREARRWLFTVATNLVRDGARSSKNRERLLSAAPVEPQAASLPDEWAERRETIASVRVALNRLSERDRMLLLMREEGFRYDEIAQVVGVAPSSVGTLIARAVRRFTKVYNDQEHGDVSPG